MMQESFALKFQRTVRQIITDTSIVLVLMLVAISPALAQDNKLRSDRDVLVLSHAGQDLDFYVSDCIDGELMLPMDDAGSAYIPDLQLGRIHDDIGEGWTVITQNPPPNTAVSKPQTVTIDGLVVNRRGVTRTFIVTAAVVDITPPQVLIELVGDSEIIYPTEKHAVMLRPGKVTIGAVVTDPSIHPTTPAPKFTILDQNGDPKPLEDNELSAPGIYQVSVSATDQFNNSSSSEITVEIKQRETQLLNVSIDQISCEPLDGGGLKVVGELSLTPGIGEGDLLLADGTVGLIVNNPANTKQWFTTSEVPSQLTIQPGQIECTKAIAFSMQLPGSPTESFECPNSVIVTGSAMKGDAWVDIEASSAEILPFPFHEDGVCLPPGPPPSEPTCVWKNKLVAGDQVNDEASTSNWYCPDNKSYSHTFAAWYFMRGDGFAQSYSSINPLSQCFAADSHTSVTNVGVLSTYKIWLEGNCDCNCTINFNGSARFSVQAGASGTSQAKLAGALQVSTPCDDGGAVGGLEVTAGQVGQGGSISVGGVTIPIDVGVSSYDRRLFQGQVNCNVSACIATAGIQTAAYAYFSASSDGWPGVGSAYSSETSGKIYESKLKLEAVPIASGSNCPATAINPEALPYPIASVGAHVGSVDSSFESSYLQHIKSRMSVCLASADRSTSAAR